MRKLSSGYPGYELVVGDSRMACYLMLSGKCIAIPAYTHTGAMTIEETKALIAVLEKTVELAETKSQ